MIDSGAQLYVQYLSYLDVYIIYAALKHLTQYALGHSVNC